MRCEHQVGDADPAAGHEIRVALQLLQFRDADPGLRQRLRDIRLVSGAVPEQVRQEPLGAYPYGYAGHDVPVDDVCDLVHARSHFRLGGLQRQPGKHIVDVAQNRLHLVEAEVTMLENGHSAKRMAPKMFLAFDAARRHRGDPIRRSLLLEAEQRRAAVGTPDRDVDNKFAHPSLLHK